MSCIIHNSAVIGKNVSLGKNVIIGPNCTIGFPGYQNNSQNFEELTVIGDNTIISGNSVICRGTYIGENCRFDYHSHVGENCHIENNCVIEYSARIYNNIIIGKNNSLSGFICNDCVIGNGNILQGILIHKFKDINIKDSVEKPPLVGNGCFIGKNAMVIGNIKIKDGCFIAAGAILACETIEGKLYKGIPAKESGDAPKAYIEGNKDYNELNFKEVYESISRYSSI
jgi:acetyltransferase-like isoleucine patch superfamily enzyme